MRIEISAKPIYGEPRASACADTLEDRIGVAVSSVRVVDVYIIDGMNDLDESIVVGLFADPVAGDFAVDTFRFASQFASEWNVLVEVTYKPGVTNPEALTAREALSILLDRSIPPDVVIQAGRQFLLGLPAGVEADRVAGALHNPLIENAYTIGSDEWRDGLRPPDHYPYEVPESPVVVDVIEIAGMTETELVTLSEERLLALNREEMRAIQRYYQDEEVAEHRRALGVPKGATDVELEMIAQTWSEHCKHKIFSAVIHYREPNGSSSSIDGLFRTFIHRLTEEVGAEKDYLRSVFSDNSGVVAFNDECLLCFKAETHNSPSALDPYGGAITGIVGVNRDILGTGKGARPIFNTDVLCFGYPQTPADALPTGLLHPKTVMDGVHRGIIDGGNQSGIPVVAGGFLFDESYTGKPLVYCGTGGIMPNEIDGEASWVNHIDPGDAAVMVGGRIGKDGIHGATFSSLDLSESSPTSAVQIGDPITQRKMLDFLMEARDRGLYKGITDNGAGGLSSSLGEMAETAGGIVVNLDLCPLKYPGLAPWEILVSESQERMSLSVDPERLVELLALAQSRDVEATKVGSFTDSGRIEVYYGSDLVADLDLSFLHDGVPQMELPATWIAPKDRPPAEAEVEAARFWLDGLETDPGRIQAVAAALLSDENIRSKEALVRQYDHEVQGRSVVKPFCGSEADGHSDGGVLKVMEGSSWGVTVTHGICPRYGDYDTYRMAACAVDEALRAHVALGGDPTRVAALDNFCWPDPVEAEGNPDGAYKLAQLVRANQGLYDTCRAYGIPLISGKDSMKNDSTIGGRKLSIRPTLLISLLGYVPDISRSLTSDLKVAGNDLYLVGATRDELGGSALEHLFLRERRGISPWDEPRTAPVFGPAPDVDPQEAFASYELIHRATRDGLIAACHDLSDGGLFVALAEMVIAGRLGADVDLSAVIGHPTAGASGDSRMVALFSESASRLLLEVPPAKRGDFEALCSGRCARIGHVTEEPTLVTREGQERLFGIPLSALLQAWKPKGRSRRW